MAYSLGINSGETDKIDNVKIEAMRDFSKVVEADANDAKAEWRSIVIAGRKARNAMKSIEKMLGQMQDLKGPAVRMIAKLEARENALAKIASAMTELENYLEICKGQRTLPTIEEMARKLFLVVIGAGHYEDFEDKVRARTRQLFAIADGLVKWQEVLENDDDDDLKERYEEAKVLASPSGKYAALLPTLQAKVEAAQHSLAAQLAA